MEYSNLSKIDRIDFKDLKSPPAPHYLAAEVVLVDATKTEKRHPPLFQLEERLATSVFNSLKEGLKINLPSHHNPFIQLGTKTAIDREKKLIYLEDETIVSYQYLIIVTGTGIENDDFHTGLQALIDALKLQPKAFNSETNLNKQHRSLKEIEAEVSLSSGATHSFYTEKAPKLVCHKISSPYSSTPSSKRVFQIEF